VIHVIRGAYKSPTESAFVLALLGLPVGAIGFFQSRIGREPLGVREPLVILVAVHFHYAAVILLIFAGALGRLRRITSWAEAKPYSATVMLLAAGSPLLAGGHVFDVSAFRPGGAMLLTVGLLFRCVMMLCALPPHSFVDCWRPACGRCAFDSRRMVYAVIYAVADYYGEVWPAIPYMARTHGIINALAFSLCGLVGWMAAERGESRHNARSRQGLAGVVSLASGGISEANVSFDL
jgi:hypothetical protein